MLDTVQIKRITSINNSRFTLRWAYFQANDRDWFIVYHSHKPNIYLVFRINETVCCIKYINGQKAGAIETTVEDDVAKQCLAFTIFGLGGVE